MISYELILAFLKDHYVYDGTDLNGLKTGNVEIGSGGSVGGHMYRFGMNMMLTEFDRKELVKHLQEIEKYSQETAFDPDTYAKVNKLREKVAGDMYFTYVAKHMGKPL
jgi:hypothetical protein